MKTSHTKCQCRACEKYFNSVAGFDKHRTWKDEQGNKLPNSRFMSTEEMMAKKMQQNEQGYWIASAFNKKLLNKIKGVCDGK